MATFSRLSIMRPSSRKFVECVVLQCRSTHHLTGHVFPIKFIYHIQWKQSYESHSYIHTSILSHINAYTTYTQYQFIHGCIILVWSYPFVSVFKSFQAVSPKQWTARVYLLSCFKLPVLKNGQLEFTYLLSCSKPLVLKNGLLEFTFFILFQATSSKQRTAWVHLFYLVSSC